MRQLWMTSVVFALSVSAAARAEAPVAKPVEPAAQAASAPPDTLELAPLEQALSEFQADCARDHGQLWGVSLCASVMLVDPETRVMVLGRLDEAKAGGAHPLRTYVGVLPKEVPIANTTVEWAGTHWVQVQVPLEPDRDGRRALLLHEAFHRVAPSIGIQGMEAKTGHLDRFDGRFWLQLEWRALAAAIRAHGPARRAALADAIAFSAERFRRVPNAEAQEARLMTHEGLAESTGVTLGTDSEEARHALVLEALARAPRQRSLVRSFQYSLAAAYGVLLEEEGGRGWRWEAAKGATVARLLATAAHLPWPTAALDEHAASVARYDGLALARSEHTRDAEAAARLKQLTATLVDGPVVRLKLEQRRATFDPRAVVPLGEEGTVYTIGRVLDVWGTLDVDGAMLMSPDWSLVRVAAPTTRSATGAAGPGWTLTLTPGWTLVPGARRGDLELKAPAAH